MSYPLRGLSLLVVVLLLSCCRHDKKNNQPPAQTLFQLLTSNSTGITFANMVNDTGEINMFNNLYMYNGGGVAIGDINNDGWQDIFFTSNQNKSCLYLNLGNFHFKDITESAGIDTRGGWTTGTVMADVNGDGFTDIYVCRGGSQATGSTRNLFYLNKGNLSFTEMGAAYGIDDAGFSTQAAFFDSDNDGDLDLYVMNYPAYGSDPLNYYSYKTSASDYPNSDHLYQNNNNHFTDISAKAKLPIEKAYGLGLVIADVNQDGWNDIYVANDWAMPDFIYINNKNNTYTNKLQHYFSKTAFFSMGADVADINNDAVPDISVCDMVPASHYRRNIHISQAPIDYFFLEKKYGGVPQYSRNFMLMSQPSGSYSEMAEAFGIAKTDWSWSTLLADYNNDGWKDIFITNGMKRDEGDMDHERLMFKEGQKPQYKRSKAALIEKMPTTLLSNYIFKNNSGQSFSQTMEDWGVNQFVNTQGAAYADLDNDGNLDLILNNVDTTAYIYRNTGGKNPNHSLRISVFGENKNSKGLGTKAWLYNKDKVQYAELTNARGFQSSSEPVLHFGLGNDSIIDSVLVVFPSSKYTVLRNIKAGLRSYVVEGKAEGKHFDYIKKEKTNYLLEEKTKQIIPSFIHYEGDFSDFKRDKLIPRMFSKEGPALAVGDLNGDGQEDFYVGGAAEQSGAVYLQQTNGAFILHNQPALTADAAAEDVAALITDLNNDGKNDLYVVSGSNEFAENDKRYQDRIYLNTGNGNLKRCNECLPEMTGSKSCVAAYDFDKDGDEDLFIGGRTVPSSYGKIPRSYILQNNKGRFTDVIHTLTPSLEYAGMLTSATWVDIDGDKKAELLIAGDWISPSVFKYTNGKLENITSSTGLQTHTGWWNCITTGDFDGDGDIDFTCGNWGLNSIWKVNEKEPLCLLVNDFDGNGSVDPVLCCFLEGEQGTFAGRDLICQSMTKYFNKYNTYESFAKAKVPDLFASELYEKAHKLNATELRTSIFINNGKGKFDMTPLPFQCQTAPVNSILYYDFDGDGKKDLLLAGNTNQNFYDQGDINAMYGVLLKGDDKGDFSVVPYPNTGIKLQKFVRHLEIIYKQGNPYLLCGNNSDTLQMFSVKK